MHNNPYKKNVKSKTSRHFIASPVNKNHQEWIIPDDWAKILS